jgi:hypothetical protein
MTRKSPGRGISASTSALGFTLLGGVLAFCTLALAYEWVVDLRRGVHLVYNRAGPSRLFSLADAPGAYWASMVGAGLGVLFLAGLTWVCFWLVRLVRQ